MFKYVCLVCCYSIIRCLEEGGKDKARWLDNETPPTTLTLRLWFPMTPPATEHNCCNNGRKLRDVRHILLSSSLVGLQRQSVKNL